MKLQEIKRKHTWTEVLGSGYQYLVLDSRGKFHLAYWMVFCPGMWEAEHTPEEVKSSIRNYGPRTQANWSADWVKEPDRAHSHPFEVIERGGIDAEKVFRLPKVKGKRQ